MSYENVISEIVNNREIRDIANKIASNKSLSEDLYQEIILKLLELDKEKIKTLYKKKELNYYIVRIAISLYRNPTNDFAKKYHHLPCLKVKESNVVKEIMFLNKETERPDFSKEHKAFKQLSWYEREICKIYAELGSSRKVQEQTGISYRSVAHTVKKSKEWITTFTRN